MLRMDEVLQETGLSRRTITYLLKNKVISAERRVDGKGVALHFDPSVVTQLRMMYQTPRISPKDLESAIGEGLSPFIFVIVEPTCRACGHLFRQHARGVPPQENTHGCLGCDCRGWSGYKTCQYCGEPLGEGCEVVDQFLWSYRNQAMIHTIKSTCKKTPGESHVFTKDQYDSLTRLRLRPTRCI